MPDEKVPDIFNTVFRPDKLIAKLENLRVLEDKALLSTDAKQKTMSLNRIRGQRELIIQELHKLEADIPNEHVKRYQHDLQEAKGRAK